MFLFFLLSFCFLSFKEAKKTLAYVTIVDYCVDGQIGTCSRGGSGDSCPYCGSSKDYCCSSGSAWTKYNTVCDVTVTNHCNGPTCSRVTVYTITLSPVTTLCSIADKWNSSDPRLVRAGLCDCSTGGKYKACCDSSTGNLVNSVRRWVGNAYDADCPAGTMIWAGGSNIDLAWADANCNPPCTPNCAATDGGHCWGATYAGNCGQTCTGNVGPSCGSAGGHCWGEVYGSDNGCGTCTGTLGSSCGDTNAYCSGTPYGSASGCGSCTGTRPTSNCSDSGSHCVKDGVYFNNGCGTCTGTIPTSNCSDSGSHCVKDGIYFNNGCGTCSGSVPTSTCSDAGSRCAKDGVYFNNGCGTCTGTIPTVTGTSGSCGGSNGGSFTVASPPTALCNAGTASGVSFSGTTYSWTCAGTAGICGGATGNTVPCAATRNLPPTFSSIIVKNNAGTAVAAEGGNINQICQTEFNGVRTVNLTVNATDPNGAGTIGDIQLRWNGINFTRTGLANGVATFSRTFAAGENTTGATDFQVYISDGVNATGWITASRSLKVWNCNVSTTGRLYDGGASGNCSVPEDYLTPATATNFKTLDFTDSPTVNMNRVSESEYNGNLTWGKVYTTIFNTDLAMQISGSGVKTTDVSAGTSYCPNSVAITLNNAVLNPYSASPTLKVDFSGVVDQDSWYQTLGGGLLANSRITNRVPVTCTTANCAMSINGTNTINGIVASPTINNTGNSGINKGNPNNWWVTKPLVSTSKSDYTYFLNQYFWKGGIGTTLNGDKNLSDIGATGVVFINGNLTINANNSVPVGTFLMMVSNGNITVQSNVTNLEGIFVSKNFNVGGSNATALAVKGMIKATNSLQINRTFVNKRDNNINPAVNFVYRPDFVFNIPKEIGKQLVKWQWGN